MTFNRKAFFRLEASNIIGAGHAVRCSALGHAFIESGWKCYIVANQETYNFIPDLGCFEWVDVANFESSPSHCDLLIIDHYGLNEEYERRFETYAKKILVLDDRPTRSHYCNFLVDQTFGRDAVEYKDLLPNGCKVLAGSKYAMIRQDFAKLRPKAIDRREQVKLSKPRIMLSLGGGDSTAVIKLLLDKVVKSDLNSQVDVVVGFSDSFLKDDYDISQMNQINFHTNPDMAQLTLLADIAIGAAGSSMWERCCLGLPTIMITISENQMHIAKNLHEYGAAINAGDAERLDPESIIQFVDLLINDPERRQEMQQKAFQTCDGLGAKRIVEVINASY